MVITKVKSAVKSSNRLGLVVVPKVDDTKCKTNVWLGFFTLPQQFASEVDRRRLLDAAALL